MCSFMRLEAHLAGTDDVDDGYSTLVLLDLPYRLYRLVDSYMNEAGR